MEAIRIEKSTEVCAYERIIQRQRMRIVRESLSGKEHLEGNLEAKRGMRLLKSEGRLKKFESREAGVKGANSDKLFQKYMQTSEKHREILLKNQPDIVSRINENERLEKERKRQTEENLEKGEWCYSCCYNNTMGHFNRASDIKW